MDTQRQKIKAEKPKIIQSGAALSLEGPLGIVPKDAYYVRFHQPVPPGEDKEPVSEFRLESSQKKYVVDSILWTPHGIVVKAYGETNIISLANVIYCRLVV